MDWSNYDNELFKKYSGNLFDDYIDNKIECGNLIEDNNNYMNDYDIKADDFVLEKSLIKSNGFQSEKPELNFENFIENNFSNENMDFMESKYSEENGIKTKLSSKKNSFNQNLDDSLKRNYNQKSKGKVKNSEIISNVKTDYSSSPYVNNQTSTNNYSNIDDSKSNSSDCASNSNKKSITINNEKVNNINYNNEENNNSNNFENLSMQNNNFSEYNDEEMDNQNIEIKNNSNSLAKFTNKTNLNRLPNNQNILKENYLLANPTNIINGNYILTNPNSNNFYIANQNNISLSERMKAKIQRTKDLLEKKQYKASENNNILNEYCNKNQKKFPFNLESAYEFSELKNNNCCKRNECPDCINIMSKMNYINNYQKTLNSNLNNQQTYNPNKNSLKNYTPKNSSKEKPILSDNQKLENIEKMTMNKKENNKNKNKNNSDEENFNALVKKNDINNESFTSKGNSKNSLMDISLNENSFNGIANRNKLSKKELKMLRNRISAQKSRDRKKKEMDDLKLITQELFNQNIKLKKQLEEKDTQISEMKNIFNSLCEICKGKFNYRHSANILLEEKVFNSNNNTKFLESAESITCCNIKDTNLINKNNIDDLRNNLINNKRNRVVDFPSIVNNGNRRIGNNIKCGLMTGFLVIACIVGSFAFNYGFKFSTQNDDYSINRDKNFPGRILQERTVKEFVKISNESKFYDVVKSDYLTSNETIISTNTFKEKNDSIPIIVNNKDDYNSSTSLAVYKKKDDNSKKISLESLNEISQKENSEFYNNIRNKINLDYYLHLSKQIVDKVNKNIYDLSYLTDLSQQTKETITKNMIENINKINKFFEIKLNQFANDNYNDKDQESPLDFSFLGRKRLNFISRNNIEKSNNENLNKKNSEFLKFTDLPLNEQCLAPKGVRYTISDFNFVNENNEDEKLFEQIEFDNSTDDENDGINDEELEIIKEANKKYFKYKSNKSNIRNFKYDDLEKTNSKSLMLKKNKNENKFIKMPFVFDNQNDNVNSLYCKDFMSMADENSEFFRRVFAKLNLQKKVESINERIDINKNLYDDLNNENELKNEEEKIKFDIKNDDDCLYLHMIVPEKKYEERDLSSGQDYKISNSSSFHKNDNINKKNNNESINNKQVFYEVGCKIFEINKIYK